MAKTESRDAMISAKDKPSMTRFTVASTAFLATNPFRPPDWRWHRGGQLLETRARRRRLDDDWVVRARTFRAALAKASGNIDLPRLARAHPEILGAYLVRHGEPRRRWETEARILADQCDRDIADRVGVSAGIIGAYDALFYDVLTWLSRSDSIAAGVLGPRLYTGFEVDDIEFVWKVLGYQHGPLALDALIDHVKAGGQSTASPELAEQLDLLIKVTATPVTLENAMRFLRLDARIRALDRAEADQSVAGVTRPIVIRPFDVQIGPEILAMMRAGSAPDDPDEAKLTADGGPIVLSDAGWG
jgi:hypothetical protein